MIMPKMLTAGLAFALMLVLAPVARAADAEEQAEQAEAAKFVKTLQALVAGGQKQELAKLVGYPLEVDGKERAKNEAAFVKNYDAIITKSVVQCAREHDSTEEVFSRNGQYMVGWGCIWFSPAEKGGMTIDAVNTKSP